MNLSPRRRLFYRRPEVNIYRLFFWLMAIFAGIWLVRGLNLGAVQNPFMPTPTATRVAGSFALEGDAFFSSGNLDASIASYREALQVDPQNAEVWAKLARIQVYSSNLLTTDEQRRQRLAEALESANRALELAPDDSTVHAIRAFALDWNANPIYVGDRAGSLLIEAEQEAIRALQLDNQNTLALAYYAEILVDQQKLEQALQYIQEAAQRGQDLIDIHRVYAYVLESLGQYNAAIQEYDRAIQIAPNLTFLHLRAGANYRVLAFRSTNPASQRELYEKSLEYFATAAAINDQLGIQDPSPNLSISKTYSQMGEFFAAGRNVLKALEYNPADADIYGQLGIVYFKSRNYETSIFALRCAVRGCSPEDSCEARGGCGQGETGLQIIGLPLTNNTAIYYYTYGSVLAALSRPQENYCPEAVQVLAEVRAGFSDDPIIMDIVRESESICRSLGEATAPAPPASTPTSMP